MGLIRRTQISSDSIFLFPWRLSHCRLTLKKRHFWGGIPRRVVAESALTPKPIEHMLSSKKCANQKHNAIKSWAVGARVCVWPKFRVWVRRNVRATRTQKRVTAQNKFECGRKSVSPWVFRILEITRTSPRESAAGEPSKWHLRLLTFSIRLTF